MTGDVAIHAVVRLLIPNTTGSTPEELILSALAKAPFKTLEGFETDIVKYEVFLRRPGGQTEENPIVILSQDHLDLLEIEIEAGAKVISGSEVEQLIDTFTPSPHDLATHHSVPVLLN